MGRFLFCRWGWSECCLINASFLGFSLGLMLFLQNLDPVNTFHVYFCYVSFQFQKIYSVDLVLISANFLVVEFDFFSRFDCQDLEFLR